MARAWHACSSVGLSRPSRLRDSSKCLALRLLYFLLKWRNLGTLFVQSVWVLGVERHNDGNVERIATWEDADHHDASKTHPTEIRRWVCLDNYEGTTVEHPVITSCGCGTPGTMSADGSGSTSGQTTELSFSPNGGGAGKHGFRAAA